MTRYAEVILFVWPSVDVRWGFIPQPVNPGRRGGDRTGLWNETPFHSRYRKGFRLDTRVARSYLRGGESVTVCRIVRNTLRS